MLIVDGLIKLIKLRKSDGVEFSELSSGRLLYVPGGCQCGNHPHHIGINQSRPRGNAFLHHAVNTPRVNSIRVEESHILVEFLPFCPKILNLLLKLLARSIGLSRPFCRNSQIRTVVASKAVVSGNSAFNKSWKPPGWGNSIVTGAARVSWWWSPVGLESSPPPIPDITVCSSNSCKNSGGNFVAIVTVRMGLLAMAFVSGVNPLPVAREATIMSESPSSHKTELLFSVPLSGAGGGLDGDHGH